MRLEKILIASGRRRTLSDEFKKLEHKNCRRYLNDEKHAIFKNFKEANFS